MRILYYDWDEFNSEDCQDAMIRLGHQVDKFKSDMNKYDVTSELKQRLESAIKTAVDASEPYDLVFSFDFFPNVSMICADNNMHYVSWVFDCPHYTIDSPSIKNKTNRVYLFDRMLCDNMRAKGVDTVEHMPLAVNEKRLSELCDSLDAETDGRIDKHDLSYF